MNMCRIKIASNLIKSVLDGGVGLGELEQVVRKSHKSWQQHAFKIPSHGSCIIMSFIHPINLSSNLSFEYKQGYHIHVI